MRKSQKKGNILKLHPFRSFGTLLRFFSKKLPEKSFQVPEKIVMGCRTRAEYAAKA